VGNNTIAARLSSKQALGLGRIIPRRCWCYHQQPRTPACRSVFAVFTNPPAGVLAGENTQQGHQGLLLWPQNGTK
jgi:hypothetical protein